MGAGASKPAGQTTELRFQSEGPVSFSQDLLDQLQANPETDNTRAKDLELKIQSRVSSELQRLQSQISKDLQELSEKISTEPATKSNGQDLSRTTVRKEIELLKSKLEGRKQVAELDKNVKKAKEDMVTCLRLNDRRPLDCWKEVASFKSEVAKLEKGFVDKVIN
ncbi:MAG: hypothetical protein M1834_009261 [Cirrosporium novae-zelandiae]|nr:MAG: hypothetical protein M1834_009261 [Cirrosporium novae-zelandiae]